MKHLLDNIIWNSLSGPQQGFSVGTSRARRYTRGFSPIVGFADPDHPHFPDLLPYCEPDEHFYVERWAGTAPEGWQIDVESRMRKMIWEGPTPETDEAPDAIALGVEHAVQAMALAQLTQPGPSACAPLNSASITATSKARDSSPWPANACTPAH